MRADLHPNGHIPPDGDPEANGATTENIGNIRRRSNDAGRGPRDAWCASWGGTRDAAPAECRHHFHPGLLDSIAEAVTTTWQRRLP